MNEFLAVAPHAQVAHGALGCMVSLDDLCDRRPRKLADGEVIDLGASAFAISIRRVGPALAAEDLFPATALTVVTASTIRRLATLEPQVLAPMHGSSTRARCGEASIKLADAYESMVKQGRQEGIAVERAVQLIRKYPR